MPLRKSAMSITFAANIAPTRRTAPPHTTARRAKARSTQAPTHTDDDDQHPPPDRAHGFPLPGTSPQRDTRERNSRSRSANHTDAASAECTPPDASHPCMLPRRDACTFRCPRSHGGGARKSRRSPRWRGSSKTLTTMNQGSMAKNQCSMSYSAATSAGSRATSPYPTIDALDDRRPTLRIP